MELSKRATDTNDLLKELAAHESVPATLPAEDPLPDLPTAAATATPTPAPSTSSKRQLNTVLPNSTPTPTSSPTPVYTTKKLATIVPKSEIVPLALEPQNMFPAAPVSGKVDVSKYTIAHIRS